MPKQRKRNLSEVERLAEQAKAINQKARDGVFDAAAKCANEEPPSSATIIELGECKAVSRAEAKRMKREMIRAASAKKPKSPKLQKIYIIPESAIARIENDGDADYISGFALKPDGVVIVINNDAAGIAELSRQLRKIVKK